jgi:predicted deacylase
VGELDVAKVDQDLTSGVVLTQTHGEIGFGSAYGNPKGKNIKDRWGDPLKPPQEDSNLPIQAFVFPAIAAPPTTPPATAPPTAPPTTPPATAPPASGAGAPAANPSCVAEQARLTNCGTKEAECLAAQESLVACQQDQGGAARRAAAVLGKAAATSVAKAATTRGGAAATPGPAGAIAGATAGAAVAAALSTPSPRAIIIANIHGNERGPLGVSRQLLAEMARDAFKRDFDTIFIPVMNPGGVADNTRQNRHGVDLNRNWPGLPGFQPPAAKVPPMQPEVTAVKKVIETFKPARILSMHSQGDPEKGGAFADPVEGNEARELACRMALRMRGENDVNAPANQLSAGVCSSRYPDQSKIDVSTESSSLGVFAATPKSAGGLGTPVITTEVPGHRPLVAAGKGRSVESILPGIREFLSDNGKAPSEADDLLRKAVSDAYVTGEQTTADDKNLLASVEGIVHKRFNDMNTFYSQVWAPQQLKKNAKLKLPGTLTMTQTRSFKRQADQIRGELASRKIGKKSSDKDIEAALLDILKTMSMPGFSRHHWGTDIDLMAPPVNHVDWEGSGKFIDLIPFIRDHAREYGFFNPFSQPRPSPTDPHYSDEPWHLSYFPIANVLMEQWLRRISGAALDALIARTAGAIRGDVPLDRMKAILAGMKLPSFQSNVAKSP